MNRLQVGAVNASGALGGLQVILLDKVDTEEPRTAAILHFGPEVTSTEVRGAFRIGSYVTIENLNLVGV